MARMFRRFAIVAFAIVCSGCQVNWYQWGANPSHTNSSDAESTISLSNVGSLHRIWTSTMSVLADGAPVYLSQVQTATGASRDLLFITTYYGDLVAKDAHSGATVWSDAFGPGACVVNNISTPCFTTSSPAVDPNGKYVYSYGLDGKVHKVAVGDGHEIVDTHWPEVTTLKNFDEKQSSPLAIATAKNRHSYLYVAHSGYPGDNGDYQGHLTTIDLADGSQRVFNTICSDLTVHFANRTAPDCPAVQSGVWARGGVMYDPTTDRIFLATGNAPFSPTAHDWGDSVLALHPDGTGDGAGNPLDTYTPTNYDMLDIDDLDLGSTMPARIPVTNTAKYQSVGVQSGKDSKLRLLDLSDLSRHGGPGHVGGEIGPIINVPQGGEVLSAPGVWMHNGVVWVFVSNPNGTSAFRVVYDATGAPSLQLAWQIADAGTSPVIVNGVLYLATDHRIAGYDPTTGQQRWADASIGPIHWESPIVVNGVLYLEDFAGTVYAYAP